MFQFMMQLGLTVIVWQHSEFDWYCQRSGSETVWTHLRCQAISPMAWEWS